MLGRLRSIERQFAAHESMCEQRRISTERQLEELKNGQAGLRNQLSVERKERKQTTQWVIGVVISVGVAIVTIIRIIVG